MPPSWVVGPVLLMALATPLAAAPSRAVKLTYIRGAGAADCPDADVVRAGVAGRLGYEPFDDNALPQVSAVVTRLGRALEARIRIVDAQGKVATERKLTSRESDCAELAAAMELAITIAIDPLASTRKIAAPPAGPAPVVAPSPPPVPSAPPAPPVSPPAVISISGRPPPTAPAPSPEPPRAPFLLQVAVGVVGAVRSAPSTAFGGTLQVSLARGLLSLGVEGRADLPASETLMMGSVRTSLLTGALVPCVRRGLVAGCALAMAGAIRASGHDLAEARHITAPFVALGGRIELNIPLGRIFLVRLHGDVMAPLTETVLRVSNEPVWSSPAIAAAFGFGIGARFP